MNKNNPEVRFRCVGKSCGQEGRVRLGDLVVDGCPGCGSKRLEVWHPNRGHVLIDYRAQKSVRKNRRRREQLTALGMGILAALFIGCTPAPVSLGDPSLVDTFKTSRPAPAVTWTLAGKTTVAGDAMDENHGRVRMFFATAGQVDTTQIWRVEWAPVEDPCFVPLAYPMVRRGVKTGLLAVQITGVGPGDEVLLWRSHPRGSTPGDSICMTPVRGDE